jgi:hypothetical protein
MNVVIDANLFSSITNPKAPDHLEFAPVLEYIAFGNGKLAYGGSRYETETNSNVKFLRFLRYLDGARRTVEADKNEVDNTEDILKEEFKRADFDDHHIIAIVILTRSRVICSTDLGLHSLVDACYCQAGRMFISRNCTDSGHLTKPRIYQNSSHVDMLKN